MVLIGAPNQSKTYQELAEALYGSQTYNTDYLFNYFKILNFYNSQNSDTKIKIANRAYADQSLALKASYSEYLQTFFRPLCLVWISAKVEMSLWKLITLSKTLL